MKTIDTFINDIPELYDDNFVLNPSGNAFKKAANLQEPESGRVLELFTTLPGLQCYTANHIDNVQGKEQQVYYKHSGIALEPQHFPDSVNHPEFPNTILQPGEEYYHKSEFRFSVND